MSTINDTPTLQEVTSASTPVLHPPNICGRGGDMNNHIHSDYSVSSSIEPVFHSEIKAEPPEDITDIGDNCSSLPDINPSDSSDCPKIRLTPTIKLMAVTNPVDPKRKFTCPYDNCTKSYGKSSHLRSHLTWHTGLKPFVCTEINCGKGFTRSDELNRHVRTHTGEKPFECIQCTKKFSRSDHLTKHLATHAKQMQNKSDASKKPRKEGYMCHAKREHYMNESIDAKTSLEDSECTKNHEDYDANGMHFMASTREDCDKNSRDKPAFENRNDDYFLDHSPIKIKLERPENSDEYHVVPPVEPAILNSSGIISDSALPICNVIKQESTALDVSAPIVNDDKLLMGWPEVGKQGIAYDPHRPWQCNLCQKTFKRQDDLNRHFRTHTGEKPFACTACERRFMRSDHLKKHLKTHTNIRQS